jgi:hypothetical protein
MVEGSGATWLVATLEALRFASVQPPGTGPASDHQINLHTQQPQALC